MSRKEMIIPERYLSGSSDSATRTRDSQDKLRSVEEFDTDCLHRALKDQTYRRCSQLSNSAMLGRACEMTTEIDECVTSSEFKLENSDLDWLIRDVDPSTSELQTVEAEIVRLKVLRSFDILDSERVEVFERLTSMAARIFDVPIVSVSLLDMGRAWFISNQGKGETPRKLAFCAHTVLCTTDLLIVPDTTKDPRFMSNIFVTEPPYIRFYAGAPLISSEGVKIGSLCVIDSIPHPNGMSFNEKQILLELAALAIGMMEDSRQQKLQAEQQLSKAITCTMHDLLIPLCGVQRSLVNLYEDIHFLKLLRSDHRELIETVISCSKIAIKICDQFVSSSPIFDVKKATTEFQPRDSCVENKRMKTKGIEINIPDFIQNVKLVLELYPKLVPVYITVDEEVPMEIVSDELKIFRSVINYLTNACKVTEKGFVHLRIYMKQNFPSKSKQSLIFECHDTGPGVPKEMYSQLFRPVQEEECKSDHMSCIDIDPNGERGRLCFKSIPPAGLGLFSVATSISSLGGRYGFFPKSIEKNATDSEHSSFTGSVFWFSVQLDLPKTISLTK